MEPSDWLMLTGTAGEEVARAEAAVVAEVIAVMAREVAASSLMLARGPRGDMAGVEKAEPGFLKLSCRLGGRWERL